MKKKIVAKISEGLGNQFFMYANSFAISKKFSFDFYIDPYSGYYKKNIRNFMLDNFNISSKVASPNWIFSDNFSNFYKKILINLEYFQKYKSFIFEKKDLNKLTNYKPLDLKYTKNTIYIDGNFESEKYFFNFRNHILNEFSLKDNLKYNNKYLDLIRNYNVVSISIRQNRYSERIGNRDNLNSKQKSNFFLKQTIEYIYRALNFLKDKINNPKYLLWSDDFTNLNEYFPENNFYYVDNSQNKILTDFYLLTQCKNFIIGPSTFSWWGAWLSSQNNKLCIRPKNINPSNNLDFWPEKWISI